MLRSKDSKRHMLAGAVLTALAMASGSASAGVSPSEAARLKGQELTPFGSERAGNATGEIPAWTGGMKARPELAGAKFVTDPHAGDKKTLTITAENASKYAARLSPGVLAMLKSFPGFHLDIYPSHRDATYTAFRTEQTLLNATRASMDPASHYPVNAYGGFPFPIPKTGEEVAWNSNLAWRGLTTLSSPASYLVPAGHSPILTSVLSAIKQADVDDPDGNYATWNGLFFATISTYVGPPARVGEMLLAWAAGAPGKSPYSVWQYLVGQRRVRKAPNIKYDGVYPDCGGFAGSDEVEVWNGETERYDMRLVGKKELYIPYDNNGMYNSTATELYGPNYINPDLVRWELHRVWVVEMTVAAGFRHAIPHRTVYFDEDTWGAALADEYGPNGALYRENMGFTYAQPGFPALFFQPSADYNLSGGYCASNVFNFKDGQGGFQSVPKRSFSDFQPDTIAAASAR